MFRGPKSFVKRGYASDEAPKRTLQQQGLEGIARMQKSFEGLSDRDAETVRTVTQEASETKTDITAVLEQ